MSEPKYRRGVPETGAGKELLALNPEAAVEFWPVLDISVLAIEAEARAAQDAELERAAMHRHTCPTCGIVFSADDTGWREHFRQHAEAVALRKGLTWALRNKGGEVPADDPQGYHDALVALTEARTLLKASDSTPEGEP